MRVAVLLGIMTLLGAAVYAQGNGIGGVLTRDVPVPSSEEEWPKILPAGGLVAFGSGRDWSASHREDGKVRVHFVIREEDGDRDSGYAMIAEDAVQVFNWACGEPKALPIGGRPMVCSPFVGKYAWGSGNEWQLRFVAEARKLAKDLGLPLVEEFSSAYQGRAEAASSGGEAGTASAAPSKCTVDQVLKMKEVGLTDGQIKAACGG